MTNPQRDSTYIPINQDIYITVGVIIVII